MTSQCVSARLTYSVAMLQDSCMSTAYEKQWPSTTKKHTWESRSLKSNDVAPESAKLQYQVHVHRDHVRDAYDRRRGQGALKFDLREDEQHHGHVQRSTTENNRESNKSNCTRNRWFHCSRHQPRAALLYTSSLVELPRCMADQSQRQRVNVDSSLNCGY